MNIRMLISSIIDVLLLAYLYRDYKNKGCIWIRLVFLIVLSIFNRVAVQYYDLNTMMNLLITFVLLVLFGFVLFEIDKFMEYIKNAIIISACAVMSESVFIAVVWYVTNEHGLMNISESGTWYYLYVGSKLTELWLIKIIHKLKRSNNSNNNGWKSLVVEFWIFILFYMFVMIFGWLTTLKPICVRATALTMLVGAITIIILIVGYFLVVMMYEERNETIVKLDFLKKSTAHQMEQYRAKCGEELELKKMYHDLRNLEIVMKGHKEGGVITDDAEGYIRKMKTYFRKRDVIATGNEILDLFLIEKIKECQDKKIKIVYNIDFSKGGFINIVDIGTIFGNLINNSIESTEKIDDINKRNISLSVCNYEQFIIINIKNPVISIIEYKGKLLTSKTDKRNHGLGMLGLKEALQNYGGNYTYKIEDNYFVIVAYIPVVEK